MKLLRIFLLCALGEHFRRYAHAFRFVLGLVQLHIRSHTLALCSFGSSAEYQPEPEATSNRQLGHHEVLVYTQEGSLWSIVLRCDDHTGIFTCDGCARDPYFYVPAETQSYVIKLSCSRKVLVASGD